MEDRGWGWAGTAGMFAADELKQETDRLGYPPEVAQAVQQFGLPAVIEAVAVPSFLSELPPRVAEVLRNCVVLVTGRSGSPHGHAAYYKNEGAVVFVDGALLLMFHDVLGHAVSLVKGTPHPPQIRWTVDPPGESTIRAVASLIWSFRQPSRGFDLADLPAIGTDPYGGEPAFGKFLWFGERFLIGHEFAHALFLLGQAPEAPGVRQLIRGSVDIPSAMENDWTEELSADVWALNLVAAAAADHDSRFVALVSCLLAALFVSVLERTVAISPQVPFPLQPADVSAHLTNLTTHPPAELRLHCLEQTVESYNHDAAELARVYQPAIEGILHGLFAASDGRCIAPLGAHDWCRESRGPTGWFCHEHGHGR